MKKEKKKLNWLGVIQVRSGLAVLITAALMLQISGLVQYFFARNGIRTEVRQRAVTELRAKNLEIQNVITSVESAINNMQWALNLSTVHPDSVYSVLQYIIEQNPIIWGCAMGFEPDYYPSRGRWYEPFVGHDGNQIVRRQIGSDLHDYLTAEWYLEGLTAEGGHWTEPYLDDAGSCTMVSSYTIPIHDATGRTIAVFSADIPLNWLTDMFGTQDNSASILASRTGRILACPDRSLVMTSTIQDVSQFINDSMIDYVNHGMLAGDSGHATVLLGNGDKGYVYFAPVEGNTGWSMAIVFPDKEIYRGLHRVSFWLSLLMTLGLGLLVFILWRTVRNINRLQAVSAEKERIGSELKIASGIQMGMLPKTFPPYPDCDEVMMYGTLVPAKEVGGDLYDFHLRDGKFFFCIGDVSGKGVPASLVMAVTRSLFRSVSLHDDNPGGIMTKMNDAMSEMNESSMFVTLFIGILDLRTGRLAYCNAGHCAPVMLNSSVEPLAVDSNIPVGVMPQWNFSSQEITLKPGTTIFTYTDGLTEAENAHHDQLGEERMLNELIKDLGETPRKIIEHMTNTVNDFVGGAEQSDDLTMLALLFTKLMDK